MFGTEINLLRDTFRRLLRRHAKTNIIKLINKTHPADMALIYRYFNEGEQDAIFNLMKPSEATVEFLSELDEAITIRLLEQEDPQHMASILEKASLNQEHILTQAENGKKRKETGKTRKNQEKTEKNPEKT